MTYPRLRYFVAFALACALALLLFVWAGSALGAASPCGDLNQVVYRLGNKYGEKQAARGVMNGGERLLLAFVNPKSKTWTLAVVVYGKACILAIGTDWETDRILQDPT